MQKKKAMTKENQKEIVFELKKNVTFDSLDEESQKLLSILGFESGDNLSEMAKNLLKKKSMTLDEYLKGELKEKNVKII